MSQDTADESPAAGGASWKSEAGTVDTIAVTNFLNHDNLVVKLGPHVNFVHGTNGAGKSAILTALIACFNEKASSTERGKNMGDLIMYTKK